MLICFWDFSCCVGKYQKVPCFNCNWKLLWVITVNNKLLWAWSKLPYLQVSLASDSDGSIKVIKICTKYTNLIYFLWDPGSHLCKNTECMCHFDLVFNLYTVHGVLYNICKISTKFHMQCILFTLASESSCILYLLHILHILNMLRKHFLWKYIG